MNPILYKRSTKGYQARRRAELKHSTSFTDTSNVLQASYKAQLDLAVKGVLFESLYPLNPEEIVKRMTWWMPDSNFSKINQVFASLQRLITNKLVAATRVMEQEKEVTKYLLNLPYEYLQEERAARIRTSTQMN